MKGQPLQLTSGEYAIKLSVLNYASEMTLKETHFRLCFLINHAFLFQEFSATDNLKATTVTHLFLGLNENFTELKSGDKSLFWHVF